MKRCQELLRREPSCGRPIGSIELVQIAGQTAKKTTVLEDSSQAVRGQKQIDEAFQLLQKKSHVSSSVDEEGKVALKGNKRGRNDDDLLDLLWSDLQPGSATRTAARTSSTTGGRRTTTTPTVTARAARGNTNPNGNKDKAKAIAARTQLFGKAEHTLLKCKQLKDSLTRDC